MTTARFRFVVSRRSRHPIQREVVVGEHEVEAVEGALRFAEWARRTLDQHPGDAEVGQRGGVGPVEQQLLHGGRAGALAVDRFAAHHQVAGLQHVRRQQARRGVEDGCVARPVEDPEHPSG